MMNCVQARELIALHFGGGDLPNEGQAHLAECESCRAYRSEMLSLAGGLGSDVDTPFADEDFDRATAGVMTKIDRQPMAVSFSSKWLQPMLLVAAVLLVVGLSYSSYQLGLESNLGADLDTLRTADADNLTALLEDAVDEEMDEGLIGILIDDYCADDSYEATASLLDDITEEELRYLTENLEVGDLL